MGKKNEEADEKPFWLWDPIIPTEAGESEWRRKTTYVGDWPRKPGPLTEVEASRLRLEAEQILLVQELLESSLGQRGKIEFALKKQLRAARDQFIIRMGWYGLDSYKWSDGFGVEVLPPLDVERSGFFRSRLRFNHE